MSDFWDTYDRLDRLDTEVADRIDAWDDTPTLTGDAMTAEDWLASGAVRAEKADRYFGLAARWGDPTFLPTNRSRDI